MCASSPPEKCDAAELGEAQVREHLLHLKDACGHSPSTIRTATAAFSGFCQTHPQRDWKLIRKPSSDASAR